MNNPYLHNTKTFSLIFSNNYQGNDFKYLYNELIQLNLSTLFIINAKSIINNQSFIFGAFQNIPWIESNEFQGNENNYIFSIEPKYQNYHSVEKKHYSFLTNKGIGFGGNEQKNKFRIWIDSEILLKSYVSNEGEGFQDGFLLDAPFCNQNKIMIQQIEVWGFSYNNSDKIWDKLE